MKTPGERPAGPCARTGRQTRQTQRNLGSQGRLHPGARITGMSDPRNVQHDKKVIQEKKHHGEDLVSGAAHVPQPGKKTAAAEPRRDPAGTAEQEDPTQADGEGIKGE